MKIVFLILGIIVSLFSIGQKPEKVHSVVKELKTEEWYHTQSEIWGAITQKNKKNAEAWYNYYAANRALKNISWGNDSIVQQYAAVCNSIAKDAYKAVPNSFEANHLMWWDGYNEPSNFQYLERAYEIDPFDARTYRDLMIHYVLNFDEQKTNAFAQKIFNVNEMPAGAYNWAYNILAEAEPNAIIFTVGDNDTYLPWIVQEVLGFRKDVTIMNTSLLNLDNYRIGLFKKIGLPDFDKSLEKVQTMKELTENSKALYAHIFAQNKEFPIYVSATAISQFEKDYNENLYLVGLTYQYCENNLDNIALIKRNYEKRYLLDYLTTRFSFHPLAKKTADFNIFYLQAFMKLHQHYLDTEEFVKASQIKQQILAIAQEGGQEENIKDWMLKFQ